MFKEKLEEYKQLKKNVDKSRGIKKKINRLKLKIFVNRNSEELLGNVCLMSALEYRNISFLADSAQESPLVKTISRFTK